MTYRFSFSMIEQPEHRKDAENIVLEQFVRALEKELAAHPEQWYNYYDFWGLRGNRHLNS